MIVIGAATCMQSRGGNTFCKSLGNGLTDASTAMGRGRSRSKYSCHTSLTGKPGFAIRVSGRPIVRHKILACIDANISRFLAAKRRETKQSCEMLPVHLNKGDAPRGH